MEGLVDAFRGESAVSLRTAFVNCEVGYVVGGESTNRPRSSNEARPPRQLVVVMGRFLIMVSFPIVSVDVPA